jgi:hypothetical protein
MPDASMPMPEGASDEPIQIGDELPVKLDTLEVGGERPEVDDHVEVTVGGRITRIIDDCAYVSVETANNEQIEKPKGDQEEENALGALGQQMDAMGSAPGMGLTPGGGY